MEHLLEIFYILKIKGENNCPPKFKNKTYLIKSPFSYLNIN